MRLPNKQLMADVRMLCGHDLTDAEMGDRLGYHPSHITEIRNRLGILSALEKRQFARDAKLRQLHAKGYTDHRIGHEMGLSPRHVLFLRNRMGLPVNRKPRTAKPKAVTFDLSQFPKLRRAFADDTVEIDQALLGWAMKTYEARV